MCIADPHLRVVCLHVVSTDVVVVLIDRHVTADRTPVTCRQVNEGKPGFFAIASPPDPNNQGLLEFLIKAQGEAATALADLPAGAEVSVSPVMGKGFSVDKIPAEENPTVLLFATGKAFLQWCSASVLCQQPVAAPAYVSCLSTVVTSSACQRSRVSVDAEGTGPGTGDTSHLQRHSACIRCSTADS